MLRSSSGSMRPQTQCDNLRHGFPTPTSRHDWVGTRTRRNAKLRWLAQERLDKFVGEKDFPTVSLSRQSCYVKTAPLLFLDILRPLAPNETTTSDNSSTATSGGVATTPSCTSTPGAPPAPSATIGKKRSRQQEKTPHNQRSRKAAKTETARPQSPPHLPPSQHLLETRITFDQVSRGMAGNHELTPCSVGQPLGPAWATHWVHLGIRIPDEWLLLSHQRHQEAAAMAASACTEAAASVRRGLSQRFEVHLIFDCGAEALVYDAAFDQPARQGLTCCDGSSRRVEYALEENVAFARGPLTGIAVNREFMLFSKKRIEQYEQDGLWIEIACNDLFGEGMAKDFDPNTKMWTLSKAHIALFDVQKWESYWDFSTVISIAKELPESLRGEQALRVATQAVNAWQCDSDGSMTGQSSGCNNIAADPIDILKNFLAQRNSPHGAITLHCVGHCHIDTAWLWPYAESRRKAARSWASQLGLMKKDVDYVFAASQAQQMDWVRQDHPKLFEELRVYAGKGQFIPEGGSWVEMDCNIPCGESLVRQFQYGQHFFQTYFGKVCRVFWLPDTFGYASQLPQIAKLAGMPYFVTQKLSWNLINKFPHHSFMWEGLDGTRILTHFPPADNYNAGADVKSAVFAQSNYTERAVAPHALYLYGHGDGGGGPQREMLDRIGRLKDVDGVPRMQHSTPAHFFKELERTANLLPVWRGELYFEMHRGTYTSQANLKSLNKQCERLLGAVEALLCIMSTRIPQSDLPRLEESLRHMWKVALCQQFHDVLPGSCTRDVVCDAVAAYEKVLSWCRGIIRKVCSEYKKKKKGGTKCLFFEWPYGHVPTRRTVVAVPLSLVKGIVHSSFIQVWKGTHALVALPEDLASCPYAAFSGVVLEKTAACKVKSEKGERSEHLGTVSVVNGDNEGFIMSNEYVEVYVGRNGMVSDIVVKDKVQCGAVGCTRMTCDASNTFRDGGMKLVLYDDVPFYWDAWDVPIHHTQVYRVASDDVVENAHVEAEGPLVCCVSATLRIGSDSKAHVKVSLAAFAREVRVDCHVEWHEAHKMLKAVFPMNFRGADYATYGTQFGRIQRPTHSNTTHDLAKFEVCGQGWADLSEPSGGTGCAVFADTKYGWACFANDLSLSLLRSPKWPDDECDVRESEHEFSFAIRRHWCSCFMDTGMAIHEALSFRGGVLGGDRRACEDWLVSELDRTVAQDRVMSMVRIEGMNSIVISSLSTNDAGNRLTIRLYESCGAGGVFKMYPVGWIFKTCVIVDLLGNTLQTAETNPGMFVRVNITPFEVVTFEFRQ